MYNRSAVVRNKVDKHYLFPPHRMNAFPRIFHRREKKTMDERCYCQRLSTAIYMCVTTSVALQPGGRAAGAIWAPGPEREAGEAAAQLLSVRSVMAMLVCRARVEPSI